MQYTLGQLDTNYLSKQCFYRVPPWLLRSHSFRPTSKSNLLAAKWYYMIRDDEKKATVAQFINVMV